MHSLLNHPHEPPDDAGVKFGLRNQTRRPPPHLKTQRQRPGWRARLSARRDRTFSRVPLLAFLCHFGREDIYRLPHGPFCQPVLALEQTGVAGVEDGAGDVVVGFSQQPDVVHVRQVLVEPTGVLGCASP